MLFLKGDSGEGVEINGRRKRLKITLDRDAQQQMRGRTWAAYQLMGHSLQAIAETFNRGVTSVKLDLKAFRDRQAETRDEQESA